MITFDATSAGTATSITPLTWNHTCSGSDRALIVVFGSAAVSATGKVTAVTYNSVSLTQIGSYVDVGGNSNLNVWYLLNPSTGTNTISATFSGAITTDGVAISLNGVSSYDTTASGTASATSITTSITPGARGAWVISGVLISAAGPTLGPTISQIQGRQSALTAQIVGAGFSGPHSVVGKTPSVGWNGGGTGPAFAQILASFLPLSFAADKLTLNNMRPRAFAPGLAR